MLKSDDELPDILKSLTPEMLEIFKEKVLHCNSCNSVSVVTNIAAVLTLTSKTLHELVVGMPIMALMAGTPPQYSAGFTDGLDFAKTLIAKLGLEILEAKDEMAKENKNNAHIQSEQDNFSA